MEHVVDDLEISKEELDMELCLQPSLFYKYSQIYSDVSEKRDIVRIQTDQLKADIYSKLKKNALDCGIKTTEKALEESVNRDPDYVAQKLKFVDVCKEFNTLMNIMEALKQKQKSISKLCDLYLAGYYCNDSHKETESEKVLIESKIPEKISNSVKVTPRRKRLE